MATKNKPNQPDPDQLGPIDPPAVPTVEAGSTAGEDQMKAAAQAAATEAAALASKSPQLVEVAFLSCMDEGGVYEQVWGPDSLGRCNPEKGHGVRHGRGYVISKDTARQAEEQLSQLRDEVPKQWVAKYNEGGTRIGSALLAVVRRVKA